GVDDAAVQTYYKAHQAEYMTPESAHLEYAQLSLAALEAQVTASDADLRAAYEKAKGRLEVPEKRHARHILITGKDDAAALTQAGKSKSYEEARSDLEAQLKRDRATDRFGEIQERLQTKASEPGADLKALAQEFSLQAGDMPTFVKGAGAPPLGLAPPLQELIFADPPLAVGRLGGPVLPGDAR